MPALIVPGRGAMGVRPPGLIVLNQASPQARGLYGLLAHGPSPRWMTQAGSGAVAVTSVGSPSIRPALIGGSAVECGGTSDYLTLPASAYSSAVGAPQTWAAWVYLRSYGGVSQLYLRGVMSKYEDSVPASLAGSILRVGLDGTAGNADKLSYVLVNASAAESSVSDTAAFPLTRWQHIAGTFDGATARLYRNGREVGTPVTNTDRGFNGSSGRLAIGGDFIGPGTFGSPRAWDGYIANPTIWSRALSAVEVWSLYDPQTRWDLYYVPGRRVFFDLAAAPGGFFARYYYENRVIGHV